MRLRLSSLIPLPGFEAGLIKPVDHASTRQFSGTGLFIDLQAHLPPAEWILLSQPYQSVKYFLPVVFYSVYRFAMVHI